MDARKELVKIYFLEMVDARLSRHLTVESINRYIYCLNKVQAHNHISEVELRKSIINDLEKDKRFEMDKKTLKRIIEHLKRDNLVKTKDFRVRLFDGEHGREDS